MNTKARENVSVKGSASFKKIPKEVRKRIQKVPKTQAKALRLAFLSSDENGDGKLSREEFTNMMRPEVTGYTEEDINFIMAGMDVDGNGFLDFAEYLAMLVQDENGKSELPSDTEIEGMFRMIDKNGDGKVTKAELKTGLATMGIVFSDEEMEMVWQKANGNKGELLKEQFTQMVKDFET